VRVVAGGGGIASMRERHTHVWVDRLERFAQQ
jgi:hypothetical protein